MKHTGKRVLRGCLLTVALLLALCGKAQEDYEVNRDSIWDIEFDFSELEVEKVNLFRLENKLRRIKAYNDSVMAQLRAKNIRERSDSLLQLYEYLSADSSNDYNAYTFTAGQYHSNVSGFNRTLGNLGWAKLSGLAAQYTNIVDYTWKRGRLVHQVAIIAGAPVSVSKNDVTITYSFLSPLNYWFGYSLIDKRRIQFFPFAGLSYQRSELNFSNSYFYPFEPAKSNYDSLIKAAVNNRRGAEFNFRKRELVLDAGAELDVHVIYSWRKTGFIVGLRAGKVIPLLGGNWKLEGSRYPQIGVNLRDYHYELVLRIYSRRENNSRFDLRRNWWE